MTLVKICGIRRVDHAVAAVDAGADFLGLVFAPSRRRVSVDVACEIADSVRARAGVRLAGVFVDEDPDEIERIAQVCRLDYVQLSGDEGDAVELGVPVIRTIHVEKSEPRSSLAERIAASHAEVVLLDTAQPGSRGGTGQPFDWAGVPALDRPAFLAGGLHAANVPVAIEAVRPWAVDVSSGVETDGEKDPKKIQEFIRAAKRL